MLLAVCVLAYGVMIPWLGVYSDDWVFLSTYHKMGRTGLFRYFTTNRPIWGLIYQVTLPLLGKVPWHWHLFGLFWHWTAAVAFWWLVRLVWPREKNAALWAGLMFVVYPGFTMQPISLTGGHIFMIYTAYFLSVCFMVLAQLHRRRFWLFTALALLASLVNLLTMEYFLLLHLMQPIFLFFALTGQYSDVRQRLKRTLIAWSPYLVLFLGTLIWRVFFFQYQTHNYQYLFLKRLKKEPLVALVHLLKTMANDWWETVIKTWLSIFRLPLTLSWKRFDFVYLVYTALAAGLLLLMLFWQKRGRDQDEEKDLQGVIQQDSWQIIVAGCLSLLIAGGPFWLTEISVGLTGFQSRFTLPFIFGAALVISGLILLLPLSRMPRLLFLAAALGLAIGFQFRIQNDFRREWVIQKDLVWQLAWRIPDLKPRTIVFSSELPLYYNASDFTQSALFDWNWQPQPAPQVMDYAYYYPRERIKSGTIPALRPNLPVVVDHLGAEFSGNTSRSIVVQVNDPQVLPLGCLRVMLPEIDRRNKYFPKNEREVIALSKPDLIRADDVYQTATLIPEIFGYEPAPNHCYYFQKADLAQQLEEWQLVLKFYREDEAAGFGSWQGTELVPVINALAHTGDWEQALALTKQMDKNSYYGLRWVICDLWQWIDRETKPSAAKTEAVETIMSEYQCDARK